MKLTVTHIVPTPSARPHVISGSCWCFPSMSQDKEFGLSLCHILEGDAAKDQAWVRVEQEVEL
jgi:hypothetical protein